MQTIDIIGVAKRAPQAPPTSRNRSLLAACLGHALHDGYTDGLYAFLPAWQSQFGLSYAGLAVIRALYYGTMGGLQLPGNRLTHKAAPGIVLSLCTAVAAFGFLFMALPLGYVGLCIGLIMAGVGSSLQHPRGSVLVSHTFADAARRSLGVYNFSGDLGKAIVPAVVAVLLPILAWRHVASLLGLLGLAVAGALFAITPPAPSAAPARTVGATVSNRKGFALLMVIGAFDTAARMGYLLFLPFLIHARGGAPVTMGIGLAFLFIGGALGKATCSWLAERLGVVGSVVATETATAVLILATLIAPLGGMLILLPLLGIVLNGTSSVLYGTVPELAPGGDVGRGFALFYTGVIGSGGLAPIGYGLLADHSSQAVGVVAAAATAAMVVPMVFRLRRSLETIG